MKKVIYETIMSNLKPVGAKAYACIPREALIVDPSFQRLETRSKDKINKLANHWDPVQMDALKVVPHPEEYAYSVVDGYGRLVASGIKGVEQLECEIILGAPEDPEERRKFEAKIFLGQTECTENLKPVQMHNARLVTGDPIANTIEKLLKEYDIKIASCKGRREEKYLGSYTRAYNVVKVYGGNALRFVFSTCKKAGYDFEKDGYNSSIIRSLGKLYNAYQGKAAPVYKCMRDTRPSYLKAKSITKYPERSMDVAMTLFLQDYLFEVNAIEEKVIDFNGKIAM